MKAADGKRYSAPDGYALTAVMIRAADEGEKTRDGHGGLAEYAKPITLTVNTGGKTTTVATIHGSDLAGGKTWIIPVPNKGDGARFTMATDGGQQVVDLASGKRVDADSNGISLTAKLNAPVASSTACDTAATPPATSDDVTLSGPLTCKVGWHLSDHITGAGWAPKGGALLVADGSLTLPQGTIKRGSSSLDEQQYTGAEKLTLTGTLDGQHARYAEAKANSWTGTRMRVVYALNPGQAPSKASINASWTGKPGFMAQPGFPASTHLSAPATLTSTTPTSLTVTTGGTRE